MPLITIFVILLIATFAMVLYFTEPSDDEKRMHQRMMDLRRDLHETADDSEEVVRQVRFSRIRVLDGFLRRATVSQRLQAYLDQAQVSWTVGRFAFFSALLVVVGATVGTWRIPGSILGWVPGVLLGLLPSAWIYYKRGSRFRRFEALLPEAIDLMGRVLRSGHALPSALVMVGDEIPDPVGTEFRRTADELSFGLPFREAMMNMERRFPVAELRFLVTAMVVQKESGGNLIDLLDKSAALLRARVVLRQKVRVFSAQGRLTGAILAALPFVAFLALNFVQPGYSEPMFDSEIGRHLVYGALGAMALGVLLIRRIVKIKV